MPQHVLIADEDKDIRRLLRLALQDAGYVAHEASDGVSALERVQASAEPLVVLLDVRLPRLHGWQVLEAVATDETLATWHAYILTGADGRGLPTTFTQLLTRLYVPVLEKPFSLDTLLEVVAQMSARQAVSRIAN